MSETSKHNDVYFSTGHSRTYVQWYLAGFHRFLNSLKFDVCK